MNTPMRSLALAVALALPAAGQSVGFQALAESYLAKHAVPGVPTAELKLQDLLGAHYATAPVGLLDLSAPREFLDDKTCADDVRDAFYALLQVHERWLDWLAAKGEAAEQARADLAELEKFVKGAKVAPGGAHAAHLLEAFNGGAALRPRLERLATSFRDGSALGFPPRGGDVQTVIVAPTRKNFVDLAALFGRFESLTQSLYWNDQVVGWTEFGWNNYQVLATQYPPVKLRYDDFGESVAMDAREATGLLEHVAQRSAMMVCWALYGTALDAAFEHAVAQTMVIETYGLNNTRSGGSGRPNTTDATEAFIPGGSSTGGTLPQNNADNRWRATSGADFFVKVVRESQKVGAKSAKSKEERLVYFQLQAETGGKKFFVRAPFFGRAAQGKEHPPAEYLSDYLEFYRAYKTLFVHWLRESSADKPEEAHRLLATLLAKVSEAGGAASFEEVVQEVYGVPFSSTDLTADTLEHRFLEWLSRI